MAISIKTWQEAIFRWQGKAGQSDLIALNERLRASEAEARAERQAWKKRVEERDAVLAELARDPALAADWLGLWMSTERGEWNGQREPFLLERTMEGALLESGGWRRISIASDVPTRWRGDAKTLERLLAGFMSRMEVSETLLVQRAKGGLAFLREVDGSAAVDTNCSTMQARVAQAAGAQLSARGLIYPAEPLPTPENGPGTRCVLIGEDRQTADYLRSVCQVWGFRSQWIPNLRECWETMEELIIENDPNTVLLLGSNEEENLGESIALAATAKGGSRLFVLGESTQSSNGLVPRPLDRFYLYLPLAMAGIQVSNEDGEADGKTSIGLKDLRVGMVSRQYSGRENEAAREGLRKALQWGQNELLVFDSLRECQGAIEAGQELHCLVWPGDADGLDAARRLRVWESDHLKDRKPLFALPGPDTFGRPGLAQDSFRKAGFDGVLTYPFRISDLAAAMDKAMDAAGDRLRP